MAMLVASGSAAGAEGAHGFATPEQPRPRRCASALAVRRPEAVISVSLAFCLGLATLFLQLEAAHFFFAPWGAQGR